MSLAVDAMSLSIGPMTLDIDTIPMPNATTSANSVTTSVTTGTTMPSLIVRLPLDSAKIQNLLNPTTSSKLRTLRKRTSPAAKNSVSQLTKKRSIDEEIDFELHNDDQSMDIDSESPPSQKPSKRARGQARKVQNVPYYGNKTSEMPEPNGNLLSGQTSGSSCARHFPITRLTSPALIQITAFSMAF